MIIRRKLKTFIESDLIFEIVGIECNDPLKLIKNILVQESDETLSTYGITYSNNK